MPDQPALAIFAQTQPVRDYLLDLVRATGHEAITLDKAPAPHVALVVAAAKECSDIPRTSGQPTLWLTPASAIGDMVEEGVRLLKTPIRGTALSEAIDRFLTMQTAVPARVTIGGCALDTRENLWLSPDESPVRLTEKEVSILLFLKDMYPASVSKLALLEKVWAYAEGVETHTLETHIYRLRQKIEADPSVPKTLLTEEDGYKISGV